ncbi:putative ankyrin repeat and BTB/POZ domain-containing protein 2-like [Scophthalmus maximus]|uniref:Putative ankyrin repeat and BTB/POZ domain-containing protein 2-like n=1 Tax=Scophthalmus maximus TaxID=52904 RepID=A0A2U9BB30_SCOMX|nr:putative ankyrin repeat and BTB/POZ domain-containing protein 2-like [Scophthalmus maximus]
MDRLLDRDDFHRLLLGGVGRELLLCPATSFQDQDQDQDQDLDQDDVVPVLLRDLEAALIHRLYDLHRACRE